MRNSLLTLLVFLVTAYSYGQQATAVPYGNNPKAGRYLKTSDAKIYYEVYGQGPPLVLLHGGLFGYIDEYSYLIPKLSEKFQVIAIATRGHGKSELGKQPLSYSLFSEDTYAVITSLTKDSVTVIGFSDGADQAYYLATRHPEVIKRLVAIGGNLGTYDTSEEAKAFMKQLSAEGLEKTAKGFVDSRKKLMPNPELFGKFVAEMAKVWNAPVYIEESVFKTIQCPTLIAAGDKDNTPIERYVAMHRMLKDSQMAIIPGSDHLVLFRKPKLMDEIILPFIDARYPIR